MCQRGRSTERQRDKKVKDGGEKVHEKRADKENEGHQETGRKMDRKTD